MKIKEKIHLDYDGLIKHGPINIVAFGDSVTHGAFEKDVLDYEAAYWNQLRKKILEVRDYVPVNTINAGIGGITAYDSLDRIESQVLTHNPDLVIVCFGLNDVNGELDVFCSSLKTIFEKLTAIGTDVIYLTPNMLNTYVDEENTAEVFMEYAYKTAEMQNNGRMDTFIQEAIKVAEEAGITVCDCYGEWKEMSKTKDTTQMLANRINHPTREMHTFFADRLFKIIFDDTITSEAQDSNTMYRG